VFTTKDKEKLLRLGVTHILSLGIEPVGVGIRDSFTHKSVSIADSIKANIYDHFLECLEFIETARKSPSSAILVHCHAGISRSATIVIAYMMWKYDMAMDDAYSVVSAARPRVQPNHGFLSQLSVFHWRLSAARSPDPSRRGPVSYLKSSVTLQIHSAPLKAVATPSTEEEAASSSSCRVVSATEQVT
jgi:hypothetical protein